MSHLLGQLVWPWRQAVLRLSHTSAGFARPYHGRRTDVEPEPLACPGRFDRLGRWPSTVAAARGLPLAPGRSKFARNELGWQNARDRKTKPNYVETD